MKEWIVFVFFMLVGLGMLTAGLVYMSKEKEDLEALKIYRSIALIGAGLAVFTVLIKFVF